MNKQIEAIYKAYVNDDDRRDEIADAEIEEAQEMLVSWLLANGKYNIKEIKEKDIESEVRFEVLKAILEAHKVGFNEGFKEAGKLFGAML